MEYAEAIALLPTSLTRAIGVGLPPELPEAIHDQDLLDVWVITSREYDCVTVS